MDVWIGVLLKYRTGYPARDLGKRVQFSVVYPR